MLNIELKSDEPEFIITYETSKIYLRVEDNEFDPKKFKKFMKYVNENKNRVWYIIPEGDGVFYLENGEFYIHISETNYYTRNRAEMGVKLPYKTTMKLLNKILAEL